ncbi:MAG TPA: hypothetical protein PKY29_01285 [Ferruginibacter sp.]|nr:hypothetical protein [Ferruginibacter sp.]HRO16578.1 hypothetical protein [Ferruginibacter sp.]HRQ19913.1 hypothetical protein [Ferruginibacter sp.]
MIVRKKTVLKFLLAILAFAIVAEFTLRYVWGFCDSVLMMENEHYEYIPQPNQERFRFRNHVRYNSFSMRADEPDTSAIIILGFGDSVINGSVMVDQDSVCTTILTKELSIEKGSIVQVLNISAGSWGPDNCYEYLKEKGDFNAKAMFLVASSHDATDNINFKKVVDVEKGYESKQYTLAIWELIDKYIKPRIFGYPVTPDHINKKGKHFNSGFHDLNEYCKQKGIPFFVYMNPDSIEMRKRQFSSFGHQIIDFCRRENIPVYYSFDSNIKKNYRDIIHLTESGHRRLADDIIKVLVPILADIQRKERN